MSLILDALKKSEQERRRGRGPDLQTIHQTSSTPAGTSRHWIWVVLLLVNATAIGSWWWFSRQPAATTLAAAAATPSTSPPLPQTSSKAPAQTGVPTPVQASRPAPIEEPQYTRIEPSVAAPRADASTPVEEFTDLPPDVRSSLPAMTFSFHVYSADPRNRTIIINNQRLREGSEVSAGVMLESITEDGVILAMDHRRVHINVLTGW